MSEIPSRDFSDIVADLDIGTVLSMDGMYVLADAGLGQEFQAELQQTYAKTLLRTGCNPKKPTERVLARLDRAYTGQLAHTSTIREGELLAVMGTDVISVGREVGDGAKLEARLLTVGEYLFGHVCYASRDKLRFAKSVRTVEPIADSDTYAVTIEQGVRDGLVLYLGASILCNADGYGAKREEFDVCAVPLDSKNFTFFKAVAAA